MATRRHALLGAGTFLRYNLGATASYTDAAGNVWLPLTPGGTAFNYAAIGYPSPGPDAPLYNTVVYGPSGGATRLTFPLPNGLYRLTVRGQELYVGAAGQRIQSFRVAGAGSNLVNHVDWYAPGKVPVLVAAPTIVVVTDGQLLLDMLGDENTPILAAIEFEKV